MYSNGATSVRVVVCIKIIQIIIISNVHTFQQNVWHSIFWFTLIRSFVSFSIRINSIIQISTVEASSSGILRKYLSDSHFIQAEIQFVGLYVWWTLYSSISIHCISNCSFFETNRRWNEMKWNDEQIENRKILQD